MDMLKRIAAGILIGTTLLLAGCTQGSNNTTVTTLPLLTGWQTEGENRYYYNEDGTKHTGWLDAAGEKYYFDLNGILQTGWIDVDGNKYYLNDAGNPCTGWMEFDGKLIYLRESGALGQGWLEEDGIKYYLTDGCITTGWVEDGNNVYYLKDDGTIHTGWLEANDARYFFRSDGRMGKGKVAVSDTEFRYFTSTGKEVILVNPWNYVPDDYNPTIVKHDNYRVAEDCLDALKKMLSDCEAAGLEPIVRSSYRTFSDQKYLYMNRVKIYLNKGYSQEEAEKIAATINAIPGTSEHQLGLAVDIVDKSYQTLNKEQENTPAQKWLMEHCWEYGFILRYPNGTTDVTGIIYEPWHYRYVGTELSMELKDAGVCLEVYLDQLTEK
jgi:D-alanyl-D-alanine carboxypeptidase